MLHPNNTTAVSGSSLATIATALTGVSSYNDFLNQGNNNHTNTDGAMWIWITLLLANCDKADSILPFDSKGCKGGILLAFLGAIYPPLSYNAVIVPPYASNDNVGKAAQMHSFRWVIYQVGSQRSRLPDSIISSWAFSKSASPSIAPIFQKATSFQLIIFT